jgi:hypothetical protein
VLGLTGNVLDKKTKDIMAQKELIIDLDLRKK